MQNRTFKISNLKHILDVEMRDDVVVVTYARHDMPEEDAMDMDEEEMEQDAMKPKDDEDEEKYQHDEDSEDDKEKNFLTPQERDFLRSLLNGDNQ
jgi:hypothetical protein